METVGWAAAIVGALSGVTWVAGHAFDQVPVLCRKATRAVRAVRALKQELRPPSGQSVDRVSLTPGGDPGDERGEVREDRG